MSHARSEYEDFKRIAPDAYDLVLALGQVAAKAGLDKQLLELVNVAKLSAIGQHVGPPRKGSDAAERALKVLQNVIGGEKASGVGRLNGKWALEEFTTLKWISVQHKTRHYPFELVAKAS